MVGEYPPQWGEPGKAARQGNRYRRRLSANALHEEARHALVVQYDETLAEAFRLWSAAFSAITLGMSAEHQLAAARLARDVAFCLCDDLIAMGKNPDNTSNGAGVHAGMTPGNHHGNTPHNSHSNSE